MLNVKMAELEYPYMIPFPTSGKSPQAWDAFWRALIQAGQVEALPGLCSPRLMPFHLPVVLQRIPRLKKTKAKSVLFVANGVSALPHFFSYGGISQVDVVDISEAAMEYCRRNPPNEEYLAGVRRMLRRKWPRTGSLEVWNPEYMGLNFIADSIFTFQTLRKYDYIFVYNFLEYFDDEDALEILRNLHNLLTEKGTLVVGGSLFNGFYSDKLELSQLQTLFSLFRNAGFYYENQASLINRKKEAMRLRERWAHRHLFSTLVSKRQPSLKVAAVG